MKQFLDTTGGLWFNGKLVNKVATPGYTDPVIFGAGGNPYGTSVTVGQDRKMVENFSAVQAAVKHQEKRTVTVAEWVKTANQ